MKKNRTIFIGGLNEHIATKDLDAHFKQFGNIKNIVFKNNKTFDEKRTFAYIVFQDKESTDSALAIDRHIIKGKRIDCQPAHGGKDKQKDLNLMKQTKIHLKGLSSRVTSEDVQTYFSQFGEVRQAYVVLDSEDKTKSKCFGFVQYYNPEITTAVLEKPHFLYGKKVKCEHFVPKDISSKQNRRGKKRTLIHADAAMNNSEEDGNTQLKISNEDFQTMVPDASEKTSFSGD